MSFRCVRIFLYIFTLCISIGFNAFMHEVMIINKYVEIVLHTIEIINELIIN
jgi:hypothetical protein